MGEFAFLSFQRGDKVANARKIQHEDYVIKRPCQASGGGNCRMLVGFGSVGVFDKKCQRAMLEINGTIEIPDGKISIGQGTRVSVGKNATVTFGEHFSNTAGMTIISTNRITFGKNVLVSWDTLIMDTDWHALQDTLTGEIGAVEKPISVGNNVWICCRSTILKGSIVADGSVVAAGAVIAGKHSTPDDIIGGNPARVLRNHATKDRTWEANHNK